MNPQAMIKPVGCDIFCEVIDNYGDIGVTWRLARQLSNEFGLTVRLWVDDLHSFARLCPEADATLVIQLCRGVEVRLWLESFEKVQPAELVIEAFACKLPDAYLVLMAARKSVWINLEYLSAEAWVEGCHKLPSPRPPLTRYFFFPGFTRLTGGLLYESELLVRRDAFLHDAEQQRIFWQSLNLPIPAAKILKISLFAYENEALPALFDVWVNGESPVLCLVPEGRILPQVSKYFAKFNAPLQLAGEGDGERAYARGNLQVCVLPFVAQARYDELLWACDVNFVRGEDSFVRAQWAGKSLVWQIYPQHDDVHREKLQAFLDLYTVHLSLRAAKAMQGWWEGWNGEDISIAKAWADFAAVRDELDWNAKKWAHELSDNNLALNLLDFFQELGTIHAFKIDEQ